MRLTPSDPDIETLYRRIIDGQLDLQPDFQRGEVWTLLKKQKLIDTILRDWHVPPIHVIKPIDSTPNEVLDGKQRLTAIRDFMNNEFPVNGNIEPRSSFIQDLHGKRFNDLPLVIREKFKQFSIRQFLIDNFTPEEPGELFFRLNSPTYLTAAEQRNAYFGEPRKQIKSLVMSLDELGIEKNLIGFSNSRMSYDDVFARVCFVFETKTLHKRITSKELSDRYRNPTPFPSDLIEKLDVVVRDFGESKNYSQTLYRFNKATLFSWFVFLLAANKRLGNRIDARLQADILSELDKLKNEKEALNSNESANKLIPTLFLIFEDRSRARVYNVDSVLIRDIMLWIIFFQFSQKYNIDFSKDTKLKNLQNKFAELTKKKNISNSLANNFFDDVINSDNWGMRI